MKSKYPTSTPKVDFPIKFSGEAKFTDDIVFDDALNAKTLRATIAKGKIKSILIDPPYNSHIDYIGYKDAFDGGYEKFMVDRIKLASELLTNDGFLVINIDEGEVDHLSGLSIIKDLFFRIKIYKWEKLHPYFDKNRNVNPNKKVVKYEFIIVCYKSKESKLNFIQQPYLDGEELKEKEAKVPNTFRCFGTNSSAKDEIAELFGDRAYFQTPKPLKLMKELVRATSNTDSIILDFFAGSGTVGHAVVDLNKEDNGKRKYILISNNESNICKDVTLKRMQMVDANVNFID